MAADGSDLHKIPTPKPDDCCFAWSADQRYFLYLSKLEKRYDIWVLPTKAGLFRSRGKPTRLTTGPLSFTSYVSSRDGKQIFAVATKERGQLIRYDIKSHEFVPLLSGISATDATFSRDGGWVAYTTYPDHALWRSRSDGSDRMQLTYPPMEVAQPFISPDGTRVAFASDSDVYLIDINGGTPQKVVEKSVIPVWSPDNNALVVTTDSAEGQKIVDLRTHKVSVIPTPDGQMGGLWLTDGMLAATNGTLTKLMTFDLNTRKWTDLVAGNFVNWVASPDHKYLYFATGGSEPKIQRLRVADHQVETVASLKGFSRVINFGWTQLGVAADDSPILTRDVSSPEIYALSVRWP
jgi:WD40 repeat protein